MSIVCLLFLCDVVCQKLKDALLTLSVKNIKMSSSPAPLAPFSSVAALWICSLRWEWRSLVEPKINPVWNIWANDKDQTTKWGWVWCGGMTEPVASVFTMTNNINIDIDQYQYPQYLFKEFGLKLGGSETVSEMFTMANHWVLLISAAIAYEIARMRCFSQEFLDRDRSYNQYFWKFVHWHQYRMLYFLAPSVRLFNKQNLFRYLPKSIIDMNDTYLS